jgi:hypothetical protein
VPQANGAIQQQEPQQLRRDEPIAIGVVYIAA